MTDRAMTFEELRNLLDQLQEGLSDPCPPPTEAPAAWVPQGKVAPLLPLTAREEALLRAGPTGRLAREVMALLEGRPPQGRGRPSSSSPATPTARLRLP